MRRPYWIPHDWNAICDVCGFKRKASQMRERWDGMRVCSPRIKEGCWELRHPLDSERSRTETNQIPWSRSEPTDFFIEQEVIASGDISVPLVGQISQNSQGLLTSTISGAVSSVFETNSQGQMAYAFSRTLSPLSETFSQESFSSGIPPSPLTLAPVFNQTSGVGPLHVHVDLSGTTGVTDTWNDILYIIDWGDPDGDSQGNTNWSYGTRQTGGSMNTSYGPQAYHIYDPIPGTGTKNYTAKIWALDLVTWTIKEITQAITATDPYALTVYAVGATTLPVAGVNGVPAGANCFTQSSWNTLMSTYGANDRCLLLIRGETYNRTGGDSFMTTRSNFHVRAVGTGAKPVLLDTGSVGGFYHMFNGVCSKITFSDLDYNGNSHWNVGCAAGASGGTHVEFILWNRCEVHDLGGGIDFHPDNVPASPMPHSQCFSNGRMERIGNDRTYSSMTPVGIRFSGKWIDIGGSFLDDTAINFGEQLIRTAIMQYGTIVNNYIGETNTVPDPAGPGNKEQVSIRCLDSTSTKWGVTGENLATKYNFFAQNECKLYSYCSFAFTLDGSPPPAIMHHNIVEGNWFRKNSAGGGSPVRTRGDICNVRNNYADENFGVEYVVLTDSPLGPTLVAVNTNVYHNTCFAPSTEAASLLFINLSTGTGHKAYNNLGWHPGSTTTMLSGGTSSNNSSDTQVRDATTNYPGFVSSPPTDPTNADLSSGSLYRAAGVAGGTGYRLAFDFFYNIRDPDIVDLGAFTFTTKALPPPSP